MNNGVAHFGGWYGGLAGVSGAAMAVPSVDPGVAAAIRNNALAAAVVQHGRMTPGFPPAFSVR